MIEKTACISNRSKFIYLNLFINYYKVCLFFVKGAAGVPAHFRRPAATRAGLPDFRLGRRRGRGTGGGPSAVRASHRAGQVYCF